MISITQREKKKEKKKGRQAQRHKGKELGRHRDTNRAARIYPHLRKSARSAISNGDHFSNLKADRVSTDESRQRPDDRS